jgi:hypothetical protein
VVGIPVPGLRHRVFLNGAIRPLIPEKFQNRLPGPTIQFNSVQEKATPAMSLSSVAGVALLGEAWWV